MDFDDQKFQPIRLNLPLPKFDSVLIDEYQDTCALEAELFRRTILEGNGRVGQIIAFGDPEQCIYSFKGTMPDAIGTFKDEFGATELPLSICYRCSKAVVTLAQKFVSHIQPFEDAVTGETDTISKEQFRNHMTTDDLVLCRTTAPLVSSVLKFIGEGRNARVEGREVAEGIVKLIDKVSRSGDIISFLEKLDEYATIKRQRIKSDASKITFDDQVATIKILSEEVDTVYDLKTLIKKIFNPKAPGFVHMTIHKSKGLEADRNVYLIEPNLLPHPMAELPWMKEEERRLHYVAITRAKQGFFYVE
jgi:superfamily I DNA/RNA helicase